MGTNIFGLVAVPGTADSGRQIDTTVASDDSGEVRLEIGSSESLARLTPDQARLTAAALTLAAEAAIRTLRERARRERLNEQAQAMVEDGVTA